jgi:hypothetical protein
MIRKSVIFDSIHTRIQNLSSLNSIISPSTTWADFFNSLLMVFKMIKEAEKTWLRLRGKNQLPKLITGVKFNDGVEQHNQNAA